MAPEGLVLVGCERQVSRIRKWLQLVSLAQQEGKRASDALPILGAARKLGSGGKVPLHWLPV
jgi:hypothetical protein